MASNSKSIANVWLLLAGTILLGVISVVSDNEDSVSNYTEREQNLIIKLREMVEDQLPQEYMKKDEYLIRWLKAKDLNLDEAKDMLLKALKWRKEIDMDNILNEDWSVYTRQFPFYMDGHDKEGRPIVTIHFGRWKPRRVILAGKRQQITRYIDYILEKWYDKIRDEEIRTNGNVTQGVLILDVNGYSLMEHACFSCIPVYLDFMQHSADYYPYSTHRIYFLNTPRVAYTLLRILEPVAVPEGWKTIRIHGVDKEEWKSDLLATIDPSQLPPILGGTKEVTTNSSFTKQ